MEQEDLLAFQSCEHAATLQVLLTWHTTWSLPLETALSVKTLTLEYCPAGPLTLFLGLKQGNYDCGLMLLFPADATLFYCPISDNLSPSVTPT